MNEYMKQTFALCGEQKATVEKVMQSFDDGAAFCNLWFESGGIEFPLNVELNEFAAINAKEGDDIAFKLALYYVRDGEIFTDEKEYFAEGSTRFASESIIPCGTLYEDGKEDCSVRVHCKIASVNNVILDGKKSVHLQATCLGYTFDLVLADGILPYASEGHIICVTCDAIGLALNRVGNEESDDDALIEKFLESLPTIGHIDSITGKQVFTKEELEDWD